MIDNLLYLLFSFTQPSHPTLPQQTTLVSASSDGAIKMWRLDVGSASVALQVVFPHSLLSTHHPILLDPFLPHPILSHPRFPNLMPNHSRSQPLFTIETRQRLTCLVATTHGYTSTEIVGGKQADKVTARSDEVEESREEAPLRRGRPEEPEETGANEEAVEENEAKDEGVGHGGKERRKKLHVQAERGAHVAQSKKKRPKK